MAKKRILSILGTRSEAIRMAPVLLELQKARNIESVVCITAEQRHNLDQVLQLFDIHPEHDLNLMAPEQSSVKLSSRIMEALEYILDTVGPDLILIQGGSVTAATAALCSYYKNIPFASIGAGLRSGHIQSSWPGEGNRRLIDTLSSIYFVADERCENNLLLEGVEQTKIHVTGCTAVDGVFRARDMLREGSKFHETLQRFYPFLSINRKLVLIACSNINLFGQVTQLGVFAGKLAAVSPETDFLFLLPDDSDSSKLSMAEVPANLHFLPQQDYLQFVYLMGRSSCVVTDFGSIQDEAPSLGVTVLAMQDSTARITPMESGMVILTGTEEEAIIQKVSDVLGAGRQRASGEVRAGLFGDGQASQRIVEKLYSSMNR